MAIRERNHSAALDCSIGLSIERRALPFGWSAAADALSRDREQAFEYRQEDANIASGGDGCDGEMV